MTGLQEIQDDILGLEAKLAGRRMELAMAIGERDTARQHMNAMYAAIQAQRDFRIICGTSNGGCFFEAAGHADQVQGRAVNA